MDSELPSADYLSDHLRAKRRRRKQWIWVPKEYTLDMIQLTRYPSRTNPLRAHPAPLNTLQHTLQLPLHSKPHIQQHPHPKPLHLWLRVEALLVCLTLPMLWTHLRLRHLWQLQSANQWHPAPPTPVSYAEDYHRPATDVDTTDMPGYAALETGYTMPAPGFTSLSGVRGPELCRGRSRGSGRSSNTSLTRLEIREALRGATANLVGDLTQNIRAKWEPLIPCKGSPTTMGASPHRLQANHLVAGLTHTLGGVRSQPIRTPAVIPRSPFVPRRSRPPYSHMENSTRAELDQLGLTALRAMFDVEPYGSSDLGGDPSDDEPPSLSSVSPSEDDDPEDPDHSRDKKKKKKTKSRRHMRRRSKEAKAITTSIIVLNLPEVTGKDLSEFAENLLCS